MNFIARVKSIKSVDSLNIVEFEFNNQVFQMVSLDLNNEIKIDKKVELLIKPTDIIISKDFIEDISIPNQALARITNIEQGKLLSSVILQLSDTTFESIITTDFLKKLNLKKYDEVNILIKATNLSIFKVLDD